jgi:WASH complex subunit strumpellin
LAYQFWWRQALGSLVSKRGSEAMDGTAFVVGVITLLKQFHSTHTHRFLAYLVCHSGICRYCRWCLYRLWNFVLQGQYLRACIEVAAAEPKSFSDLPAEVITVLQFIEEFCDYSNVRFVLVCVWACYLR